MNSSRESPKAGQLPAAAGNWLPAVRRQGAIAISEKAVGTLALGALALGVVAVAKLVAGQIAYVLPPPEHLGSDLHGSLAERLEQWRRRLPVKEAAGRMMDYPWDLVEWNAQAITEAASSEYQIQTLPLSRSAPEAVSGCTRIVLNVPAGVLMASRASTCTTTVSMGPPSLIGKS